MLPTVLLLAFAHDAPFAVDLYKQLAADAPGRNVFCSPFSLFSALAMTAEGARGETAAEMRRALRVGELARVHGANATLNARFNARAASHELHVANALFADMNTPFRKPFLDAARTHYKGSVFGVDYRVGHAEALRQINAWADRQTRGRIKEALPSLSMMTRLVLLNAVYFKGDWAEPFSARSTRDDDFLLGGTEKAHVPMMSETLQASRYGAFQADGSPFATPIMESSVMRRYPGDGFQVLEMPYAGGELSMVLLAPCSPDGLASVEKLLTAERLRGWIERLEKRAVVARVPRFTLRTDYNMIPTLEALGMRRAFKAGGADFSGMVESGELLCIGQVRQKAFVEVNEKGTEAAAVSAVEAVALSAAPRARPFVPVFSADRPFAFLIRDRKTGTILFIGRVTDPRKE